MTILESLTSICGYPISPRYVESVAIKRGLDIHAELSAETMTESAYQLANADIMAYLVTAPTISQGGQSYSLADDQRRLFLSRSEAIYKEFDNKDKSKTIYGYKGSRL